ncbi:hypothetical protein C8F04DRAFT_1268878 [Mycena alexandri]|uniref:EthD domain-containing protein n=1 Tax=Mycena alexandri TaxID=1745969 RepID=A0AAD6SEV9_9AGAR|nr:hypothetical protein C8F04DRAFT_1268878 [Mycena alexandri]
MPIRIIAIVNRLPHISFKKFDKHWAKIHGLLMIIAALPAVKSGVVKYKQTLLPHEKDFFERSSVKVTAEDWTR